MLTDSVVVPCTARCGSNTECSHGADGSSIVCTCIPEYWSPTRDGRNCIRMFTAKRLTDYYHKPIVSETESPYAPSKTMRLALPPTVQPHELIVTLNVSSNRPLAFRTETFSSVVYLVGEKLYLLENGWNTLHLAPGMFSTIVVSDNRTYCLETGTPGPCETRVLVSFTLAQFNPGCPESTFSFSTHATAITWQPPILWTSDGFSVPLSSSHTLDEQFPVGTTLVSYADLHQPQQADDLRFKCSFNVSSRRVELGH